MKIPSEAIGEGWPCEGRLRESFRLLVEILAKRSKQSLAIGPQCLLHLWYRDGTCRNSLQKLYMEN
jgi:hypothetical protein